MADLTFAALDEAIATRISDVAKLREANTAIGLSRTPNAIKGECFSIALNESNRGILRDNPRASALTQLTVEHSRETKPHEQAKSRRDLMRNADSVIRALHSQTWATEVAAGLRFRWLTGPVVRDNGEHLISTLTFDSVMTCPPCAGS